MFEGILYGEIFMGVSEQDFVGRLGECTHGCRSWGWRGTSPPEFGVGDADANFGLQNMSKSVSGQGSAPEPTGGTHNAAPTL